MKFVDLFAGLGGFRKALESIGHECVFACEIDEELRGLYIENFPAAKNSTYGDIRKAKTKVPPHDILCAGFPCQPFSKSGLQQGRSDETLGTLFDEILDILRACSPQFIILENVGNFERHEGGRTWKIIRESLESLGYTVRGTEHKASGGHGLLSPHHLGYPHSRERFFIVGRRGPLPADPFPASESDATTSLTSIIQPSSELSECDKAETALTSQQLDCINHWNSLLAALPEEVDLPSFPIWGDEISATYPFEDSTPYVTTKKELRECLNGQAKPRLTRKELIALLPSYARTEEPMFPPWKCAFIRQNREWLNTNGKHFPDGWVEKLKKFPPSLRKLEWNCKGEERDLWKHVLQFRPSGLRVKRMSTAPALVAMTSTQIPIIGSEKRFLTRIEGLRLQGFDDKHKVPATHTAAFRALGNAVHVEVVKQIALRLLAVNDKDAVESVSTTQEYAVAELRTAVMV